MCIPSSNSRDSCPVHPRSGLRGRQGGRLREWPSDSVLTALDMFDIVIITKECCPITQSLRCHLDSKGKVCPRTPREARRGASLAGRPAGSRSRTGPQSLHVCDRMCPPHMSPSPPPQLEPMAVPPERSAQRARLPVASPVLISLSLVPVPGLTDRTGSQVASQIATART